MEINRASAYDDLPYPSAVYSQTHPANLGVIAILSGMTPAPVERCRVLELGCGDGFNLLSMAYGLPKSEFLGVDLAAQPIARGNAMIKRLGLTNISLQAMDVADLGEEIGQFDYIIAHGLYSWVPAQVRERILAICRNNLTAQGVAYISYNAYPGNHLRDLVRGMMRYHAAHFSKASDQIAQSRGLIRLLSEAGEKSDPYLQILGRELDRIKKYTDAGFFHDDLSATNQPFYFHEFMAAATRHELQFLGEAEVSEKQKLQYPPHIQSVLDELDPSDTIGGEQYRDFLRCRAFRQTLLCREGITLNRSFDLLYLRETFISGEIRPVAGAIDIRSDDAVVYLGPKKAEFETDRPLIKAAFQRLADAWPQSIHFPDLLLQVRNDLANTLQNSLAEDAADLASALLQASIAGGLELRTNQSHFVLQPSEKPTVSALARVQIETSNRVSTFLHGVVQIDDDLGRFLLRLLDGTRDRRALLDELQAAIADGRAKSFDPTNLPLTAIDLENRLTRLASMALLIA